MAKKEKIRKEYLWQSRRRNALGLPWTLTVYRLDQDRLYIQNGFFTTVEDEIRLYRITDITLRRTFWQKIFGLGTIRCDSSDVTMKNFSIINVKHSKEVKDMISKLVDESRLRNRVYTSEQQMTDRPHRPDGPDSPLPPPMDFDRTDVNGNGIPDSLER